MMKSGLWMTLLCTVVGCQTNSKIADFVVVENPHSDEPGLAEFSQYITVMGMGIYGEDGVETANLYHAAAILAELIDNDEDGQADDVQLLQRLQQQNVLMPIFVSEGSKAEQDFHENYEGEGASAVLYNDEMDPSKPGHWGADATIEELIHTINHVGHVYLYPEAFGLEPGSSFLSEAMDLARGGRFEVVPDVYPAEAWYHYDDKTCDYRCMAIEYMYWAQVTNMGILADEQTCNGIANEWRPCTPELLGSTDILMYNLVTDQRYGLPQLAPDGRYQINP